jgi:diketogulonate reductase-like aldo/keto reductase
LKDLGIGYVDLYLIHWPAPKRRDSWCALTEILKSGKCRAIGVSNYTVKHLDDVKGEEVQPAVNQVELHPWLHQKELIDFAHARDVRIEAYSPLARGERLRDKTVARIAQRTGRTPAQVLIRWSLEHDLVVIPKSVHRDRIVENADVFGFSLTSEDMSALDALDENLRTCWDPTTAT